MQKTAGRISVTGIFLLMGLAIMGGSVYAGWRTVEKAKTAAAWPTVPAYITDSRIHWTLVRSAPGSRTRSSTHFYELAVTAAYRVEGEFYTSSTPAVGDIREYKLTSKPETSPPDAEMVALFKQAPPGTVVPIHYNPAHRNEAYIFTDPYSWKLYQMNVVFFLFGILPFLLGLVPMLLNRFYK